MKALWRLGWRGLTRNRRFALLFVANLALGLCGLLLILVFSTGLSRHLDSHLQELLTADLMLQASRPLTEPELNAVRGVVGGECRWSRQVSFYTMVQGSGVARLAQVVAIDAAYPLYGGFRDNEHLDNPPLAQLLQHQDQVVLSRATARLFGVQQGDPVTIGQTRYRLAATVDLEPGGDLSGLSLAPTLFMGLTQAERSGLIRFGSRIFHRHFIRLPATPDKAPPDAASLTALADKVRTALSPFSAKTPEISVVTTNEVHRRLGKIAGFFRSFLGLASLVSLALAALAASYLYHHHLRGELRTTAMLLALGASHGQCLALALGQLALLGLVAAAVALALVALLLPWFANVLSGLIPAGLELGMQPLDRVFALLVGLLGSLAFGLPMALQLRKVRPALLLQDQAALLRPVRGEWWPTLLAYIPGLALLGGMAVFLSRSLTTGLLFLVGLLGLAGVLALLAILLLRGCHRWSTTQNAFWRIIWRNLARSRAVAVSAFVSLGLALLLAQLIPQSEQGLVAEIGQPEGQVLPELFLIDIQEAQQEPLIRFFQHQPARLSALAPMVSCRMVQINDQPFAQWRRQHQIDSERGLGRTEFNLSSRAQLDPSERVVAGPQLPQLPWQVASGKPFALSMEQGFAQRLQVGIGDRIVVDIQGIELEGEIINLRQVRWNSFQPNFFMLVQAGVLDQAPKTYLASVSGLAPAEKEAMINRLNGAFPNVSVLDVRNTVDRLTAIGRQLILSLRFMAALALITGLMTVAAIARQEMVRREPEMNLLRVLGATAGTIRFLVQAEFALLAGAASAVALILCLLGSWGLSWMLFDRLWQWSWPGSLLVLGMAPALCALLAWAAVRRVLRSSPAATLR